MNAKCFLGVLRDEARGKGKGQTMLSQSLNVSLNDLKVIRKTLKGFKLGKCMILYLKNTILTVIVTCLANFQAWK